SGDEGADAGHTCEGGDRPPRTLAARPPFSGPPGSRYTAGMNRVLITAGAAGIGLSVARAFHAAGARVYICDIDRDRLAAALHGLPGLAGSVCEVGDRAATAAMVDEALCHLGGID